MDVCDAKLVNPRLFSLDGGVDLVEAIEGGV